MDFKETDMYQPLKAHFQGLGFDVKGEVKGLDIALVRDGQIWGVEMKKGFTVTLLYQALSRQKATNAVFVAIPRHVFMGRRGHILHILESLSLGLVTVAMDSPALLVDVHLMPNVKGRNTKASKSLLAEFAGRNFDDNVGGSSGRKLLTASKERSLQIACALEKLGQAAPSVLVSDFGCNAHAGQILYQNAYGWFVRVSKGVYALSEEGKAALDDPMFARIVEFYRETL
ncbi:MAG: DUF2161 family putative PD-(D/E)XK-type phosphodiesterase [Defluviitaleaceae bacterium]|nr:DUF2161 family putative PD-(D/E)XK-type phosphodiesterase [Defluviitaleaceae bacterium]